MSTTKSHKASNQEKQTVGFSITECCYYLGTTRQAYYKQCKQASLRYKHEQEVLQQVQQERMFQPRIGTRKLHYLLNTIMVSKLVEIGCLIYSEIIVY